MKQMPVRQRFENLNEVIGSFPAPAVARNALFVYQDGQTRDWAREAHEHLAILAGGDLRSTWWKLGDLSQPGVLAGAVSKAIRAELVVVAVQGNEGLPLPFYVWVDTWLPHRVWGTGALITLLAEPDAVNFASERLRNHLRAVAREGGMKFVSEEIPAELPSAADLRLSSAPDLNGLEAEAPPRETNPRSAFGRSRSRSSSAVWWASAQLPPRRLA